MRRAHWEWAEPVWLDQVRWGRVYWRGGGHGVAEDSKIDKVLRLILLMQQDQAGNAGDLAATLDVTKRTVHRYLEALDSMGVPWYFDAEAKRYRIRGDFFLPPICLTATEAIALIALVQHIAGREQVPLTRPAWLAVEKVRGRLSERVVREMGDASEHIHIQLAAGSDADPDQIQDIHDQIDRAIRRRRKLRCRYDRAGGDGDDDDWFRFQPYRLWFEQRAWYAVGLHEGRSELRNLKVSRFVAVEETDLPYAIPDDFSIDAHRGLAWRMIRSGTVYDVAIRFEAQVADTVSDTRWHSTQQIEYHDDGSITFHCQVDGLDEICHWILSYGPAARVLSPPELAERLATMARETVQRYQ